jgi:hypothetical protein
MKKYYNVLGLEEGASKEDIEKNYKELSKELDPKYNDNQDFFKEEFALLQEAYEKLMGHPQQVKDSDLSDNIKPDSRVRSSNKSQKTKTKNIKFKVLGLIILVLISIKVLINIFIPIPGCIDPKMYNFNKTANTDDGSCIPFLYGCIDRNAINFNIDANTMKDSACVIVENVSCIKHLGKPKKRITVDTKKFKDVTLEFVYSSCDEVIDDNFKLYSTGYHYRHKVLSITDTLTWIGSGDNYLSIPVGENIKVIEHIKGYRSRNYYIDINKTVSNYLINPRGHYRYKTEKHTYGGFSNLFSEPEINKKSGFFIKIDHRMDWWFEEAPSSISVTTYNGLQDYSTHTRYNIMRY